MHIERSLIPLLKEDAQRAPVIAILGPRQSGKTTLAQQVFANHTYVSFEDYDNRVFADSDPRLFLSRYENDLGIILDEVQHVPSILSYIQTEVDLKKRPGYFVLTGSQNFLLHEAVTQTLAGRIAIHTLLPFSIAELRQASVLSDVPEDFLFKGGYPIIYSQSYDPVRWYADYISTYVERDVRTLAKVDNLITFVRFLKLCAGRIGQVLNISSLAHDAGVTFATARSWLSILQASYIIFLMQPHFNNFGKRFIKSPKLFFYDSGLACSLLGIEEVGQIYSHYLRGGLFETMVVSDLYKQYYNIARKPHIYFWRDKAGHEVDAIVERAGQLFPVEVKAGQTVSKNYFSGLSYWNNLSQSDPSRGFVVYAGADSSDRSMANVVSWRDAGTLIHRIRSFPL